VSEWSFTSRSTHIGHVGDESFQAITCTGTDNSTQTGKYTKTQNKQTGSRCKNTQKPLTKPITSP